jgi:hypothetical protein
MATPARPAYPTTGRFPGNNSVSRQEVYDYLMTKDGMTDLKANAIMANIEGESAFYYDAIEDGNVSNRGLGLFQHTFPTRKEGLVEEVPDWETNWKGQIDYAMGEAEMRRFMRGNYDNEEEATEAFMQRFEMPAITSSKYPGKTLVKRGNKYFYLDRKPEGEPNKSTDRIINGERYVRITIPKEDYDSAVRTKVEGRLEVYNNTEYRQNLINEVTQEEYETYFEGAESVTVDGDNVVATYADGQVITEPKRILDRNIKAERNIQSEGGVVGVDEKRTPETTGQDNQPTSPPVTGPGIEGDIQTIPQIDRTQEGGGGLSNEEASPQDTEDYEYEVDEEEAKRVFGPTAKIGNALGKKVIVYTDSEGNQQEVDADSITEDTPDYKPPVEPYEPPVFEDQPSVQDRTQAPPVIEADPGPPRIEKRPVKPIEIESKPLEIERAITPEVARQREEIEETIRDAEKDPRTIEEIDAERAAQEEEELRQERIRRAEAEEGDEEEIEIEEEEQPTEEFYPGTTIPIDADPQRLIDEGFVYDREKDIYVKREEETFDPGPSTLGPASVEGDDEQVVNTDEEGEGTGETDEEKDPTEGITVPEGVGPGEVFEQDGKTFEVKEDGSIGYLGEAEIVDDSASQNQPASLSLDEVQQIYGPDASIGQVNGRDQIQYIDENGQPQNIFMSDAVLENDNRIATENELQTERDANVLGLKRKDFKNLSEEDLNSRLDETTLSDEEKSKIKQKWTNANKASILDRLYEDFVAGDDSALKKAGNLLKSAGGVSSLVAGFIGAKAAKRGMEEVPVPRLEGLSTAFKQYSQQQKALAESGLSYAERQTLEQGIDQAYEAGIQNLVRGTGGDRAKFLAGTGALDFNRQTSLLKIAALEDEARRQNRAAYGDLLKFEATQNREKDVFTKSREYNQKLADKAMFQNTASAAFQHVFDNVRFGQDYKPLMDQMTKTVNQLGNVSQLLGDLKIETTDPNDPNEENDENR